MKPARLLFVALAAVAIAGVCAVLLHDRGTRLRVLGDCPTATVEYRDDRGVAQRRDVALPWASPAMHYPPRSEVAFTARAPAGCERLLRCELVANRAPAVRAESVREVVCRGPTR